MGRGNYFPDLQLTWSRNMNSQRSNSNEEDYDQTERKMRTRWRRKASTPGTQKTTM